MEMSTHHHFSLFKNTNHGILKIWLQGKLQKCFLHYLEPKIPNFIDARQHNQPNNNFHPCKMQNMGGNRCLVGLVVLHQWSQEFLVLGSAKNIFATFPGARFSKYHRLVFLKSEKWRWVDISIYNWKCQLIVGFWPRENLKCSAWVAQGSNQPETLGKCSGGL